MSAISIDALPADPLAAIRELTARRAQLDRFRRERIQAARAAGSTWGEVGEALGVSAQSAPEQYFAEVCLELAATAEANAGLTVEEAMGLSVDEVRSVRESLRLT